MSHRLDHSLRKSLRMYRHKNFIMLCRPVFIVFQLLLTIYFIANSYVDWNETPMVTSIHERKVENEPFPAVSLCYPKTWKWPGIIKAAAHMNGEDAVITFGRADRVYKDFFSWGLQRQFATKYLYYDDQGEGKVDHCKMYDKILKHSENDALKETFRWLMDYAKYFKDNDDQVGEFDAGLKQLWAQIWNNIRVNETEAIKVAVCQNLDLVDCDAETISAENPCDLQITTKHSYFARLMHAFSGFDRFQNRLG